MTYINSGQTNFKGYVCEVGLKSLFIDHSGEIFLGNCCIGGVQGHMDEPDEYSMSLTKESNLFKRYLPLFH